MTDVSQTLLEFDAQLRSRAERLAAARKLPIDELLRTALREFVDREEKRAEFQKAATDAWSDYEATGLHATFDEVDAWLARLENGEPVLPPKCHG